MDLYIGSLNTNGFRSNYKHGIVKQFIESNKVDILLLQETYVDNMYLAKIIERTLGLNKRIIWNFGKSNSCGVAILLISDRIQIENFHSDFQGRIIRLDFAADGYSNFRIVNAYFPTDSSERLDFINNFSQHLAGAKNLILGGDFNFILDPNLDKIGGNLQTGNTGCKPFKTLLHKHSLIDCFRYLYPDKKNVTWTRSNVGNETSNYDIVATRLDRFYISTWIKDSLIKFENLPCVCSDHNYIKMNLEANVGIDIGKSYWKLNDELLDDNDFVSSFQYFWKLISRSDSISLQWWDQIKHQIKLFCIDYSKNKNRKQYGELKNLKRQFNKLNLKSESDLHYYNEIKLKVKEIEKNMLKGSIIRSKTHTLESNENPTNYFFQKEACLAKSKIIKSITHNNNKYTRSKDILTCFKSYYRHLYSEEPTDSSLNSLFLHDLPQISSSDDLFLQKKIEKHEILNALKEMKPNKSPGCDGLSSAFYLKFFHLFGDVLCDIINLAYETGELSNTQKLSYITLICKDESRADEMKCYRPISLLNIDYKIISKVITIRLGKILPKIIDIDQTCSVKGRSIFDNIHLLRNVIDYINQKNLAAAFVCLDQEKAFDRVSRSYMFDTLTAFGFSENFIRWIRLLYNDISSSVIINNHISDSFPVNRGVRQGCSLSMLLYVICFEPFAHKIRTLDEIKGLQLPGSNLEAKLSLYADDSTAILTNDSSIHRYFYWVKMFGRISGAKINYDKSKGMYLGKWKNRSDHPFGISWIKHQKILGYTFGTNYCQDDIWSKIFLKIDNVLNLWRSRQLSYKGKSTVLNSLCLSKLLYYTVANVLPSHYEILLQRRYFRFIWNSKYEPVSRQTLYLEFNQGGLNIPCLKLKCESLYLSHLQKLINDHNAKWTYFAKYWIGMQLRKFNPCFASNSFPHSEHIPIFYKKCITVFDKLLQIFPDICFNTINNKLFYKLLLSDASTPPKIEKICPSIDFHPVWKNINSSYIDPVVRNTLWRLCHDIVYVNYYLYEKNISTNKFCPLCSKIETVNHLFLECYMFSPLNKVVLLLLRKLSKNKITFSEKTFRYFVLPNLSKYETELALIILSESRHLIWTCRNLAKHEREKITKFQIVSKFLNKLRFRILIDKERMPFETFIETWCILGFCCLDIPDYEITFNPIMDIKYYFQKQIISD